MSDPVIRDMQPEDEYFVSTCSHVNESEEPDQCGARRAALLRALKSFGLLVKVALLDRDRVGFAYGIPIEHASWERSARTCCRSPVCTFSTKRPDGASRAPCSKRSRQRHDRSGWRA